MNAHPEDSGLNRRHRVVVIGSGFGGLNAVKKLKRADVDIKLIARTTHHLFQPMLYQVATGIVAEGLRLQKLERDQKELIKKLSLEYGKLQRREKLLDVVVKERTRELQEAQAHVLHQEKMAAFGLLAAGIAHEVGNPLTSISSLIQMLQRRDQDAYTKEKLALISGQLERIQTTLPYA